jgi:hypothetical protein
MAFEMEPDAKQADWTAFQRIQEVQSAARINLIRVVSVVLFFSILLCLYFGSERTEDQTEYLVSSARVCVIWLLVVGLVVVALKRRRVPPLLKYATSFCDVLLLTTIATAGAKAESTLVIAFFIIVASTFLRLSNKLIAATTLLCICGYLALVYQTDRFWIRPDGQEFPFLEVARPGGGLAVMGLIGWQLCLGSQFGVESLVSYERSKGGHE